MGKPYGEELVALEETYRWASKVTIEPLEEFMVAAHSRPLLAIGSGGTVTAAHLAAMLHRHNAIAFARHVTPLEFLLDEPMLHDGSVLLLSASGKNGDILAAVKRSIYREAKALATLSTRTDTPLGNAARSFERSYVFEADAPSGKDGFLATNSLLATSIIIARAYGVKFSDSIISFADEQRAMDNMADRSTALILHGGWAAPIATDLESKLNESAFIAALVSDYRNFGHGRHVWLSRRASDTIIVLLVTPETENLAHRTRALLPTEIPVIELLTTHEGAAGTLDLMVQGFQLVGRLGELNGIDPGKPEVPAFGRELFRLAPAMSSADQPPPVVRKLVHYATHTSAWKDEVNLALERFIDILGSTNFGGIAIDYDGALCARADRFGGIRPEIADLLCSLLEGGMIIGFATARGPSVRKSLQSLQKTLPRPAWKRVLIGYYHGGAIGSLVQHDIPSRSDVVEYPLSLTTDFLQCDPLLSDFTTLTFRPRQITVEPKRNVPTDALMSHVMTVLAPLEEYGIRVLASSHSVDLLPPGVSKLAVVQAVKHQAHQDTKVLCIGDRGAWPGSDCALLSHIPSLSVDEVSASLSTCWNIAPLGEIGTDAALRYLKALSVANGIAKFNAKDFWKRP